MLRISALLVVACSAITWAQNYTWPDGRIYGGRTSRLGQFPYQALLFISSREGNFVCGGSLISDQWVVTAAHCTKGASSVTVTLGVVDSKATTGQRRVSREHYEYQDYDERNIVNDIAVVKLPTKVTLNNKVNIINLPKQSQAPVDTFTGKLGQISGWGRTRNRQSTSTRYMQFATAKVMQHSNCRRYYYRYTVSNGEICTTNAATKSGTCNGDSGGPLAINLNGKPVLAGITSWGVANCETDAPSVYTNVAAYLGFIHRRTGIPVQ